MKGIREGGAAGNRAHKPGGRIAALIKTNGIQTGGRGKEGKK